MQGSPLLRALILAVSLVAMAGIIASVTHRDPAPSLSVTPPPAEAELAATLTIQLSAPARSVRMTTLAGDRTLLDVQRPEREADYPLRFPLRDERFTALLSITWETPGEPNFLRLILEPEDRESREVLLHAPEDLDQHAVEFSWPAD